MSNENQSALDLFSNNAESALTQDELLSIHGGATNSGGGHDSSSHSSHHDSGGGSTGLAVPPVIMQGIHELERGARAAHDTASRVVDAVSGIVITRTPILRDVVMPPPPRS